MASACSGKHRSVRNGEGDLRRPATKMTKMVMMQGLRRRVTRWRGRGRCGGASGLLEGARERRWPRWCSSVAAGAFGEMGKRRGREQGEGMRGRIDRDGTEEEDPRRCAVPRTQAGRQVAWQHGRARASGTRSASDWRGGDDDWQLGQWAALLGWVSGQVSSLSISLFLISQFSIIL